MPNVYKTLGQVNPAATTLTTAYTVPSATSTVVSTMSICNRSGVATTYRFSVAIAGAADDNKQYVAYDAAIAGNEVKTFTIGMTLAATDVVRVYATLATLSFVLFGSELT